MATAIGHINQPQQGQKKQKHQQPMIAATSAATIAAAAAAPATQQPATSHRTAVQQQKPTATAPVTSSPFKMDYTLFCIPSHMGFPEHKSLDVSSMYRMCEDLKDVLCVCWKSHSNSHLSL
jgi:hypothetical protein